jgi:ferrous iron transport protein A
MNSVSLPLCDRCLEVCDPQAAGCLAMGRLECGQRAFIAGYREQEDMAVCRRLFDLGFAQGVEVQLIRRAPMRDPLVFQVGGGEMLLRRQDADRIVVRVV